MKREVVAGLCVLVVAAGCGRRHKDDDDGLVAEELALVEDSAAADQQEAEIEAGIEEALSGAEPADPEAAVDPAVDDAALMTIVRTNPGKFFQPAGCIVTTVSANIATHVFTDCTGPLGLKTFKGTVTSTWIRGAGGLSVTHATENFEINGATVSGSATIQHTRNGLVFSKTRMASWSGKTAAKRDFARNANYTVTYDANADKKCLTRDGSATTTIGGHGLQASITGYKRCGIGALGCPQSGTITVKATPSNLTLTLTFPGGAKVVVTRPSGVMVTRPLICRAS
jgi:hypothetical protein